MKRFIVVLIALSLGVMTSSGAFGQGEPFIRPRGGGPPVMSPEDREKFRIRVGMNTQQQEQMETLFKDIHKRRTDLFKRMRELFEEREKVTDDYEFDHKREKAIRNELGKINAELLNLHTETEEKIRKILNKEQFEKLREIRKEQKAQWQKERGSRGDRPPPPMP